jgi:GNAT superfamily N-acetyltransferase
MSSEQALLEVRLAHTRRDRRAFVTFPWQVYRGDPNWVPPLISERIEYLDPAKGPFYRHADVVLFLACRGRQVVGTIAAFVPHQPADPQSALEGGFGFFEVLNDYPVAARLLDAACEWLRARGATVMRGPMCFSENEYGGVLIEGADCPPAMLEAHSPPYYPALLEQYGMEKDHDLYAWRAFRSQVGDELKNIPADLGRVAEVARRSANVTIRKLRPKEWDREVAIAHHLFNTTLSDLPGFVPLTDLEFRHLADPLRLLLDPDLALFAEADGQTIGFCIAVPDINRVLIRLNGRLFPFGWLKLRRYIRQIDVVSFKLMGVLEQYRRRGIDALLYLETVRAFYEKGYEWLDGSLTSEFNPTVNLIAQRLGAERYKHYRLYQKKL